MNHRFSLSLATAALISMAFPSVASSQDSTEELIRKLRGQAGKEASGEGFQTRGLYTRSLSALPEVDTQTRSLYFAD